MLEIRRQQLFELDELLGSPTVLSLFSGCGGLDLGFCNEGFELKASYDHWKPATEVHRKNQSLLGGEVYCRSLKLEDGEIQLSDLPKVDVVLGGPPCQGFSFAGRQSLNDSRNRLYLDFIEIVKYLSPKCFLMENVRGIEAMALEDVKSSFSELNYQINVERALATNFGVAQKRERIIIVGVRNDLKKTFVPPEESVGGLFLQSDTRSVIDAIGDLPEPRQVENERIIAQVYTDNHVYTKLSEMSQKFVRHIPNGGYYKDAPIETLPDRLIKIIEDPVRYRSPRLFPKSDPNKPAQTVPADTNPSIGGVLAPDLIYENGTEVRPVEPKDYTVDGVYTAPSPSRRFTPREAARLQSFPDEFLFDGAVSTQFKLIGNAVPVLMAQAFAREIRKQLFP